MNNLFDASVQFVDGSFGGKQKPHFERTVHWYLHFKPEATEAEQIAAYCHDIERALRAPDRKVPDDYLDPNFLTEHQEGGANIMVEWLKKHDAPTDYCDTVWRLISKHEVGGDTDQDRLMNADSISFFETNAEMFVTKKAPLEGNGKVAKKLTWMFERMNNTEAQEIAREHYEHWINQLN